MTNNNNRILIIEDDQFLRDLYGELLHDEGYSVEVAVDGESGLAKMTDGGFDLILLDIMLPKKDGLEILKTLKAHPPKAANGQVVVLTNLGQDAVIKECLASGAAGYLIKSSLTPDQVLHEVRTFLAKNHNR